MKHGLSFDQFRYNFKQILELHNDNSKIIVLGRPTAFLSEGERAIILGGHDHTDTGQSLPEPGWPEFTILDIADWTVTQAHQFIASYFPVACRMFRSPLDSHTIERRLKRLLSGDYDDLCVRPVHAKMLVVIASERDELLDALSEFQLYDRFTHRMLRRELDRPARDRRIGMEGRRRFASQVAWWMWSETGVRGAHVDKIPSDIINSFMPPGNDYGIAELRRELVSGCFVDKRMPWRSTFLINRFKNFLYRSTWSTHELCYRTFDVCQS